MAASKGTYACLLLSDDSKEKLFAFCNKLGIEDLVKPEDYHCTLVYSSVPCPDIAEEDFKLPIEALMKNFEIFGEDEKVLVMELFCPEAKRLHTLLHKKYGAHYDYDSYNPHITIAYAYTGELPTETFDNTIMFVDRNIEELDE